MKQFLGQFKHYWSFLKPYLYPLILSLTLIFMGLTLKNHWQEVSAIRISLLGWTYLTISIGVSLLGYVWAGWVWGLILRGLKQPVSGIWAVQAYLQTNIAKYLPGNVVHLYGRTVAATGIGVPLSTASLSVLLDTLLMAAAGLIIGLLSVPRQFILLEVIALGGILIIIHPRILNFLLGFLAQIKEKKQRSKVDEKTTRQFIHRYPLWPLLGEFGFVLLRGIGFILAIAAFGPVSFASMPLLMSVYSISWLLGFVTPGAPGGLGIFEVTAITLLNQPSVLASNQSFSPGVILSAVALYRLSSILAEGMGAGLAWLDEKWQPTKWLPW